MAFKQKSYLAVFVFKLQALLFKLQSSLFLAFHLRKVTSEIIEQLLVHFFHILTKLANERYLNLDKP